MAVVEQVEGVVQTVDLCMASGSVPVRKDELDIVTSRPLVSVKIEKGDSACRVHTDAGFAAGTSPRLCPKCAQIGAGT